MSRVLIREQGAKYIILDNPTAMCEAGFGENVHRPAGEAPSPSTRQVAEEYSSDPIQTARDD
jgi:hypothetical protein